ncbi:hypothetical protein [Pseudogracilibacillus sp. SO30301A]|uniref:hypothetical protein n=1 Tax=Pseudogracilibacillus sp. SO30301A TaxID=3098291 RepID=UPI00300E4F9D
MNKIKIFLNISYPMWEYNENGELVDNDLVEELKHDVGIDCMFVELQNIYDGLYEDNAINFEYRGFSNEVEKEAFIKKVEKAISLVKEKVGEKYIIENNIVL